MTSLFKVLSCAPLWLLHAAGWFLGWTVFLASARYRQRLREHAALAGCTPAQVRAAVGNAGCMVAELPRLWFGAAVPVAWDNDTCVDRAYAAGRGVLFLTPHLGCFEVTAQALAERYGALYGPLTVLYRPARQPWLAQLMLRARQRPGLQTAPTTLAGVRLMLRALRRGHAVGLLPDQVPPAEMGVWSAFFGRDAYTMTLSARLASQSGAAVVLLWGERLARGRGFRIHCREPTQPLQSDVAACTRQINQEMERLIRECPSQYLWAYARYRPPLAAPDPGTAA